MHRAILKAAVNKGFVILGLGIDLVREAYGVTARSGATVIEEVDGLAEALRQKVNQAIDEIPGPGGA